MCYLKIENNIQSIEFAHHYFTAEEAELKNCIVTVDINVFSAVKQCLTFILDKLRTVVYGA